MSRLEDQVEAKIARANRAFRLSSRIVAAAHRDLENHDEWLERHRATWAEEVKRHRRLLNRKLAMRSLVRFATEVVFAAPFALAQAIGQRLKDGSPRSLPQSPPKREPPFTRQAALQLRISRLDEREAATKETSPERIEAPRTCPREFAGSRAFAAPADASARGTPVSAFGVFALLLIAAGAVRAMLAGPPTEAPEPHAPKVTESEAYAPASQTVTKSKKPERGDRVSGLAILPAAPPLKALELPARTVSGMMTITRPLSLAPDETEAVPVTRPERPPAPKQAAKTAKPKRKVAARDPEPLPWWQEWSWIRVR